MNEDGAARCPEGEGMMGGPREWEEREEGGGRNEEGMVCDHVDVSVFLCVVGSCSIVGCTRHPHIFCQGAA